MSDLRRDLEASIAGEVRFDRLSRALYSTDASVYQIAPLGVVVPRSRDELAPIVRAAARHGASITARGGGTSQAGQAIGAGLVIDTSKYLTRILEVDAAARTAWVEPGVVLDVLNAHLSPHGLRFAPDISTASRATVGGMIANNSSGARSVRYGKTIDHVLELDVVLADGEACRFAPVAGAALDAACAGASRSAAGYRAVRELASACRDEIDRRFPKVLRRVGGYNLDEFVDPGRPFNLARLIVGSEGTLALVAAAKVALVPLPAAKAVVVLEFETLLDALAATPLTLAHGPSAVEVMDRFILEHAREQPSLDAVRRRVFRHDPGAVLCVEFYADEAAALRPRMQALEDDLARGHVRCHAHRATSADDQARIWRLREAALGLSMAMKGDAKSLSFVEDTAVAPERLRDYIERFLAIVHRHGTVAGVYAHASVGCLHVRPVVDLKTADGVARFEAIANDIADLVLEFGGALSGEHGDGLVRGPFTERMFGPTLYQAFRRIKRTFDPDGLFNPGKIVDSPPLAANLRYGAKYRTPEPATFFDFSDFGGLGRAVEMCSGLGACRKTIDGTMCPSYMATREERHSTRGRANALRLAMAGGLPDASLDDEDVREVLDLCLECRACRSECPVGVDVGRFKSEFLAGYWQRHGGAPLRARAIGRVHALAAWGSRLAPLSNVFAASAPGRWLGEKVLGIDRRRTLPAWARRTFERRLRDRPHTTRQPDVWLFNDTFTNYTSPDLGIDAVDVLERAGAVVGLAPNVCCGRPLISQGLLEEARALGAANAAALAGIAASGQPIVFLEPSCLSAVREDLPALVGGGAKRDARAVAGVSVLFEEFLERAWQDGRLSLRLNAGPAEIVLHGHCHQKAMGLLAPARALLARVPGSRTTDLDAGCCGLAGSFGYAREHFDVSRQIGERRLLPAARGLTADAVLVASGTSCRHQVADLAGRTAVHPATLLRSLLASS